MKISQSELQRALEEKLARHSVPGASVAVFHAGEVVTAAAGVGNVSTGVELTRDTVMHIGSITKVFNATLVMQLVDEGAIGLDEPVLRYLPELRLKDRDAVGQITVKMLLNHTSGIDGDILPDNGHDEETIEKGIARFAELGQIHRPGAEFSYCNAGSVIAGYLVQRLRGKSWYRLVRERIFEPLEMTHSAALPEEALLYRASVGHFLDAASRPVRTSCAFLPLSFAPAGMTLMMSATDLIAFARAHMSQGVGTNGSRILSARGTSAMQAITVNNKGKGYTYTDGMGLGWMVSEDGLLHHSGGGPGIFSVLYAYPQQKFAAAILTNAEFVVSCLLINEFMEPWLGEFGTMKPLGVANVRLPSGKVDMDTGRYVGVYEDILRRYSVSPSPDGLALSRLAKYSYYDNISTIETPPARLVPLGDERFLMESDEARDPPSSDAFRIFTFRHPGADGQMRYLGNGGRLYPRVA